MEVFDCALNAPEHDEGVEDKGTSSGSDHEEGWPERHDGGVD